MAELMFDIVVLVGALALGFLLATLGYALLAAASVVLASLAVRDR